MSELIIDLKVSCSACGLPLTTRTSTQSGNIGDFVRLAVEPCERCVGEIGEVESNNAELLEALKTIMRCYETTCFYNNEDYKDYEKAKAAIAKAESKGKGKGEL